MAACQVVEWAWIINPYHVGTRLEARSLRKYQNPAGVMPAGFLFFVEVAIVVRTRIRTRHCQNAPSGAFLQARHLGTRNVGTRLEARSPTFAD